MQNTYKIAFFHRTALVSIATKNMHFVHSNFVLSRRNEYLFFTTSSKMLAMNASSSTKQWSVQQRSKKNRKMQFLRNRWLGTGRCVFFVYHDLSCMESVPRFSKHLQRVSKSTGRKIAKSYFSAMFSVCLPLKRNPNVKFLNTTISGSWKMSSFFNNK